MSARPNTRGRGNDAMANLLLLDYKGRLTVVPRPQGYQSLLQSLRRYIPDIPHDHGDFVFGTNELAISQGKFVIISDDAFEMVVPLIHTIKVVPLPRNETGGQISASETSQTVAGVKRRREDSEPGNIIIRTLTNTTWTVSCSSSDTIARVKELVRNKEGIPPEHQRFMYNGAELQDDRTLADYSVQTGATITLILKLRGGKPVIYLFPPVASRISVKLLLVPEWEFSAIYPVVPVKNTPQGQELEWVVHASPDGGLKELNTGLEVSYLYWEAETNTHNILSPPSSPILSPTGTVAEAFVPNHPNVNTTNSVLLEVEKITPYLDSSLKALGLHAEAQTSFITYYSPRALRETGVLQETQQG
ncbi:hypothetical protein EST38_g6211 [Candolleomyces aberdarensis]|uniref:Ubiquitin-like domain-containing protein n=1 Tax=Candolleomyces aberdarensis TaxID=2316362 RepID=A0A4V1Q3T0_9AGAR|nr:hypothetical protein EST38_g6211 [Candolleomyces aberdarensis]